MTNLIIIMSIGSQFCASDDNESNETSTEANSVKQVLGLISRIRYLYKVC